MVIALGEALRGFADRLRCPQWRHGVYIRVAKDVVEGVMRARDLFGPDVYPLASCELVGSLATNTALSTCDGDMGASKGRWGLGQGRPGVGGVCGHRRPWCRPVLGAGCMQAAMRPLPALADTNGLGWDGMSCGPSLPRTPRPGRGACRDARGARSPHRR